MDDSVKNKAAEIGAALNSAGVAAPDTSDVYANRKAIVEANLQQGVYFPIEPRHVENYEELIKHARNKSAEPSVMLNTNSSLEDKSTTMLLVSPKEAVVVVSRGSLEPTPALNTELTEHMLKKGNFVELDAELAGNYDELVGAAKGKTPAFVVLDKLSDDQAKASVQVVQGTGNEPIVIANKNAVAYTEKFAKEFIQDSDVEMQYRVHQGQYKDVTATGMAPELYASMAASAARRNLGEYQVYEDIRDLRKAPFDAAGISEEGSKFILVNKAFLDSPLALQQAAMEHEQAHLELKQGTAKAIAERHNEGRLTPGGELKLDRDMEAAADKAAVREAANPAETARNLIKSFIYAEQQAAIDYTDTHKVTLKEAQKKVEESITDHPPLPQRIHDVRHYAEHPDIPAPLATPAMPDSVKDRNR